MRMKIKISVVYAIYLKTRRTFHRFPRLVANKIWVPCLFGKREKKKKRNYGKPRCGIIEHGRNRYNDATLGGSPWKSGAFPRSLPSPLSAIYNISDVLRYSALFGTRNELMTGLVSGRWNDRGTRPRRYTCALAFTLGERPALPWKWKKSRRFCDAWIIAPRSYEVYRALSYTEMPRARFRFSIGALW